MQGWRRRHAQIIEGSTKFYWLNLKGKVLRKGEVTAFFALSKSCFVRIKQA